MAASKRGEQPLTLAQRLAVFDRKRQLEDRAEIAVSEEILRMQGSAGFNAERSNLPHARPAPPRAALSAATRRAVQQAEQRSDRKASYHRAQLVAITAGIMPGTEAFERWMAQWLAAQGV